MIQHSNEPKPNTAKTFSDTDGRYEKHIPIVQGGSVQRISSTWKWRDHDVYVEHVGDPTAKFRMLLVHGAGGNSAAMWPYAAHLSKQGAHVTVPDLPGYGKTLSADPGKIRYDDWRNLLVDLVREENDDRPLVIMGASMGGMLAYDVAAETGLASGLVVTCLLDPRDPYVRKRLTWHPLLARMAGSMLKIFAGPFANFRVPIRWIADMRHIANAHGLTDEVIEDKTAGGGRVPLGWMRSFLESAPAVEPEHFTNTPVLMIHPGDDRWTPLGVSQPFFDRIAAKKTLVILDNCGHFPVEEPGFSQMLDAVGVFLGDLNAKE